MQKIKSVNGNGIQKVVQTPMLTQAYVIWKRQYHMRITCLTEARHFLQFSRFLVFSDPDIQVYKS